MPVLKLPLMSKRNRLRAKGGYGLIITEDYNIAPNGHGFKATAGFWNDEQIESHSQLPPRVHKYGAKILAQIYHCGRQTNTGAIPGMEARSSSRIACPFSDMMPRLHEPGLHTQGADGDMKADDCALAYSGMQQRIL